MRVLHIIYEYFPIRGGYCYRSRALFEAEQSQCIEPVVCVGPFFKNKLVQEDFSLYNISREFIIPHKVLSWRPAVMHHLEHEICRIARKHNIDIIHSHDPPLLGIAGKRAASKLGIPSVHHFRGLSDESSIYNKNLPRWLPKLIEDRKARKKVLGTSQQIICISQSLQNYFEQKFNYCGKTYIIPNGINPMKYRHQIKNSKASLGWTNKFILLYAGNPRPLEGLDLVIRSLPALKKQIPSIRFVLLSKHNEYVQKLANLANFMNVTDAFEHIGEVPHETVGTYIRSADIYVLPRPSCLVARLVTALKPFEPMLLGTPVLASDLPANREIIDPDQTGYLFRANSSVSFIQKVVDISKQNTNRITKQAKEYVLRERNWNTIGKRLSEVYHELLS